MSAALALILAAAPTLAPIADLAAIDREVERFTGVPAGAEGGASLPVDRRLRLAPCRSPLALSWRTPRQETVLVECPDAGSWRIFVPVRRSLGPLGSGAGGGVAVASAINRGDAVTIAVAGEGFAVSQPGEALDGGPVGAWIRVRTLSARAQPMRARIVRPGLVEMPLP